MLVLVFLLTGLAAGGLESLRFWRTARWSASAALLAPEAWFKLAHHSGRGGISLDPNRIAEVVVSGLWPERSIELPDAPVRTPAGQAPGEPSSRLKRDAIRRNLHVSVDRPTADTIRVALAFSSPEEDRAVQQVNGLLAAYAAELRLAFAREALRQAAEIGAAEERLQRELHRIKSHLDALVDRAVQKTQAVLPADDNETVKKSLVGNRAVQSSLVEESTASAQGLPPPLDRADLQKQLNELQRRRDLLLRERTALHPEVRQIDGQIRDAEKQLGSMPSPVAQTAPEVAKETSKSAIGPLVEPAQTIGSSVRRSSDASKSTELAQATQILQELVDEIDRDLKQLGQKIPGANLLVRGDDIGIQWADRAEMPQTKVQWQALALVALTAGLVAAAGAGMLGAGLSIDRPFEGQQSIEQGLSLPVIGTIAVARPPRAGAIRRATQARWRRPCIFAGLAILAAYCVFLIQPFLAG